MDGGGGEEEERRRMKEYNTRITTAHTRDINYCIACCIYCIVVYISIVCNCLYVYVEYVSTGLRRERRACENTRAGYQTREIQE